MYIYPAFYPKGGISKWEVILVQKVKNVIKVIGVTYLNNIGKEADCSKSNADHQKQFLVH